MAKGKTNAPLSILVTDHDLFWHPSIQALVEQGHTVALESNLQQYDRVIGPQCYRMTPELLPFVTLALKDARAEKRAKRKGGK